MVKGKGSSSLLPLSSSTVKRYCSALLLFGFFSGYHIALFDEPAADRFSELKAMKVRIGTMDLKTAAIALAHGALLLTANKRDFEKVPGLRFENWLD